MNWDHNCQCFPPFYKFQNKFNNCRYHTDPSGTFVRYDAKAIGSGSEAAQSELQDKWHKVHNPPHFVPFDAWINTSVFKQQMTLREAQLLTLSVLKQVMEEKLDQHNVQLAQVCLLNHGHVMTRLTPFKGDTKRV